MNQKEFVVNGFEFINEKEYNKAKLEAEKIEYVKANTDIKDVKKALKLYHKMLEKKAFHTVVGAAFLHELRDQIIQSGIASNEFLATIPAEDFMENKISVGLQEMQTDNLNKYKNIAIKAKHRVRRYQVITVGFLAIVIIMFVMAITSDKTAFTDYKEQVLNEYASWEEELTNREKALEERESKLQTQTREDKKVEK